MPNWQFPNSLADIVHHVGAALLKDNIETDTGTFPAITAIGMIYDGKEIEFKHRILSNSG